MKTSLYSADGKKLKQIEVPEIFSAVVRTDLIQKITESMKRKQPYAPNPLAGNNYSASGKLKHHRHVWKSQYGRGMSRIPRKQMSRKGSQFNWVGATVPNTRGGRRAHPPKVISMIGFNKVNKKELKLAELSALGATASEKWITKKYSSLAGEKMNELPFVVESKFSGLKAKNLLKTVKAILGEKAFGVAVQKKKIRTGGGKLRGRKYKNNAGLLIVLGKDEKFKTTIFDTKDADTLSVTDLANGSPGRLTLYTEKAIEGLKKRFSASPKDSGENIKPKKSLKAKENKE
jgi:large subunit ribosomal protein L4e